MGVKTAGAQRSASRRRLSPEARRQQLVEAGLEIFGSRTYEGIDVEEIAVAAGVSTGLMYHYFESKRDYYLHVLREATRLLLEVTAPDPALGSRKSLERTMDVYVQYLQDHGTGFATVHRGALSGDPEVRAVVDQYKRVQVERALADLGLEPGQAPAIELAVRGWLGFVVETSLDWVEAPRLEPKALRDLFVDAMTALLRAAAKA